MKFAKEKTKKQYDKKTNDVEFKIGEKLLLQDETVRRGRSKKLSNQWIGPYIIIKRNSKVNYTLQKGKGTLLTHANRLKPYFE